MAEFVQKTTNANTPAVATGAVALASNPSRIFWQIQNVGTNPIFVLMGTGATSSIYHFILKGGSGAADGLGASFASSNICYTGPVTIAGTTPSYIITEIAP